LAVEDQGQGLAGTVALDPGVLAPTADDPGLGVDQDATARDSDDPVCRDPGSGVLLQAVLATAERQAAEGSFIDSGYSWTGARKAIEGGLAYHVLNRANARLPLFRQDADHAAFERVLEEAFERHPLRILGY
jgi:hypothetical protein